MIETKKISGLGVSFGVGIGKTVILEKEKIIIPRYKISDKKAESERFLQALNKIKNETKAIYNDKSLKQNLTKSEILNAYIMIIEDRRVVSEVLRLIEEKNFNAEAAVNDGLNVIAKSFETMDFDYLKERALDITDIKNRLLGVLLNVKNKPIKEFPENTILVCEELTISDSMKIDFSKISGIIAKKGGKDSHACIIARSLEIPAVFNINNIFSLVKNGDLVALNGATGEIVINPDENKLFEYRFTNTNNILAKSYLNTFKNSPCITADGEKINLYANITCLAEAKKAAENAADGIGLFRSEFIYINKSIPPSEDEQFDIYKNIIKIFTNKTVTIRTIDIGGDKSLPYLKHNLEENPALGYRGIRVCLDKTILFRTQLKAIFRASIYGNVKLLLPMVSSLTELIAAKNIINEVKEELDNENIKYNKQIKLGIMIETPSAAIMSDIFAKECDFFSIGTNDLIQYTMATDRNNPQVANLYSPYHPSVLRLINYTVKSAKKYNIPCNICGEAAANSLLLPAIIGFGLKNISVNPNFLLKCKKDISHIQYQNVKKLSMNILKLTDNTAVKNMLVKYTLSLRK